MPVDKEKTEELSIEEAFEKINDAIERLEDSDLSLEASFEEYKKGMELIKLASGKIEAVEKKVKILSAEGDVDEFE